MGAPVDGMGTFPTADSARSTSDAIWSQSVPEEAEAAPAKPKVGEGDFFIDDTPDEFDDDDDEDDDDIDEEDEGDIDEDDDEDEEDEEDDDEDGE